MKPERSVVTWHTPPLLVHYLCSLTPSWTGRHRSYIQYVKTSAVRNTRKPTESHSNEENDLTTQTLNTLQTPACTCAGAPTKTFHSSCRLMQFKIYKEIKWSGDSSLEADTVTSSWAPAWLHMHPLPPWMDTSFLANYNWFIMDQVPYQVPSEITIGVRKLWRERGAVGGGMGDGGQCRMSKSICIDWQKVHFAKEDEVEED